MLKNLSNPKDFWSGVMFISIGLGFAFIARTYSLGTANRMGPGYFPFYLGLILAGLGGIILFNALRSKGDAVEKFHWRPILWVLGSIVMFGVFLKTVGMVIAGILLVCGASYGGHEFKVKGTLILAVLLVVFCSLVFVFGLKLPIPMCPDIESVQQLRLCRV